MPREVRYVDIVSFVEKVGKPIRSGAHANLVGWLLASMNITTRSYEQVLAIFRSLPEDDRLVCEWDGGHVTTLMLREWSVSPDDGYEDVPPDSEAWAQVALLKARVRDLEVQVDVFDGLHAELAAASPAEPEIREVVVPCGHCAQAQAEATTARVDAQAARAEVARSEELRLASEEREAAAWQKVQEHKRHRCEVVGFRTMRTLPCGCVLIADPRRCTGAYDIGSMIIEVTETHRRDKAGVRSSHRANATITLS